MKNIYTIIGVLGICVVSAGAYFIAQNPGATGVRSILGGERSLIEYIPGELGQVLILEVDDDLIQVAQATQSFEGDNFEQVLDTVEEVIIYQHVDEDTAINLLFIDGEEGFDISTLQEAGLIVEGDDYLSRQLGPNQYVYSDTIGLEWYDAISESFSDQQIAQTFIDAVDSGQYNAGFFSTPSGVEQLGGYSALLASNLQSTYLVSSLNTINPTGKLILQMNDDTIIEPQGSFAPILQGYYNNSLFYLELQAIQDFLGIDDNQIQTTLPFIAGSAGIPLPSPDGITQLLQSNIALTIQPSLESPFGIQASLVIEGTQHFDTLNTLYPLLEQLINENVPLLGTGTTLTTETNTNSTISTLALGETIIPVLSLTTDEQNTQLALMGAPIQPGAIETTLEVDDQTVAVFGRDSSLLNQIVGAALPTGTPGGSLQGTITVNDRDDQIVIGFEQTVDE